MLIGAHVSTSGGLPNAVARGVETGSTAIQIFNQSPRMWRPTKYSDADFKDFREAMDDSPIEAVVIHSIYLINPGTDDKEMRVKALGALTHALNVGEGIGATGVVLHPGPVKKGDEYAPTVKRIAKFCKDALKETDGCKLLLENAAGANAVGGKFEHLREIIDMLDGDKRLGVCIDTCHSHAAGYDVRTIDAVTETVDELDEKIGLDRVHTIHLNDSRDEYGSHRDRHDNLGDGFIGKKGLAAVLSEPRLKDLPFLMETPGKEKNGPDAADVKVAFDLYKQGVKARKK
jgi:deoxyribonuclease-4